MKMLKKVGYGILAVGAQLIASTIALVGIFLILSPILTPIIAIVVAWKVFG